ncbi:MAG: MFS transporter [Candidatus Bathyarchaeota archaeon]|nr:MFS transporter [Candidatus Bathyarchaeota archaeon]
MEKQRQIGIVILATISVTYLVENFLRSAASALTPVLIDQLSITRGAMGFLITGYFLIYGVMQFPAGFLAGILGPRRCIVWFTALTCIGSVLFWMSYRYELLFAAQFIMGVGTSVFYINAVTLISRWFPQDKRATAIGVLSASSGVGAFASYMGLPLAVTLWGDWRMLYLVMLGVLVVNWGMNFFLLKDGPQNAPAPPKASLNIMGSIKDVLRSRGFYPPLIGFTMTGFTFVLYSWITQFLIEDKGLTYIEAGTVSSIGTVAGFIGCLLIGVVSDRLRKRKLPVIMFLSGNILLLAALVYLPAGLPMAIYAAVWFLMGICGSVWILFFSIVSEVLSPERAGIGLGMMNGLSTIISSLATPIYGSLVDVTGTYLIPNLICLGLGVLTVLLLAVMMKETYGVTAQHATPSP